MKPYVGAPVQFVTGKDNDVDPAVIRKIHDMDTGTVHLTVFGDSDEPIAYRLDAVMPSTGPGVRGWRWPQPEVSERVEMRELGAVPGAEQDDDGTPVETPKRKKGK